ncbi:MAG: hypothetical protein KW793_03190 [Candidatus Doudnabacteria bacterium]|nr:hypothetical protein [Candidatus Doudnabacteria bacterium]
MHYRKRRDWPAVSVSTINKGAVAPFLFGDIINSCGQDENNCAPLTRDYAA